MAEATTTSTPDPQTPTRARRWAGDRSLQLVAALIGVRVGALVYLLVSHQELVDGGMAGDVRRYMQMATALGTPYHDFQVEYPPITFLAIKLLAGADHARSIAAVAVSQFACDVGIALLLAWAWNRRAQLLYLVMGLPLILHPFVYARIDLFTTFLCVLGLALVRRGWDVAGGAGLGIAVLAKLWPIAVAPVLIIERRVRGVVALVVAAGTLTLTWLALGGFAGVQQVVSFRDATGWQVESVPGILWHLRDPSRIKFESGAFRTGVMPAWARPSLTLISLGLMVLAWWLAARKRRSGAGDEVSYAEAPLAAVLSLLLFAPILSPQYVVWMLPFAALVAALTDDRLVTVLTLVVTVLTTVSYYFVPEAAGGEVFAILPVLARNFVLVALLVVAFQRLAGVRTTRPAGAGPRPAGEPTGRRATGDAVMAPENGTDAGAAPGGAGPATLAGSGPALS